MYTIGQKNTFGGRVISLGDWYLRQSLWYDLWQLYWDPAGGYLGNYDEIQQSLNLWNEKIKRKEMELWENKSKVMV